MVNSFEFGFYVPIQFKEDTNSLYITNGVDASGYNFELKNPTLEKLKEIVETIRESKYYHFNKGYLTAAVCGKWVQSY